MFEDLFALLVDVFLFVPRVLFWLLIDAVSLFLSDLGESFDYSGLSALSAFTSNNFGYFVAVTKLNLAVGLVASGFVIRFLIRRIPLVG